MPPKRARSASQKLALLQAQALHVSSNSAPITTEELAQSLLKTAQANLLIAEQRIAALGADLLAEKMQSEVLQKSLEEEREKVLHLEKALQSEKAHSDELYKQLWVAQRARQHCQIRKGELEEKLKLLKSADQKKSDDLKQLQGRASKIVEKLFRAEKETSTLCYELSKCLE